MSAFVLAERAASPAVGSSKVDPIGTQFASVLTAAQAGADWAWTLLYRSAAPQLLGYLRAQGAHDPENLLGEVFLQVARNIKGFTGDEPSFRSWLFLVAHNRVIDDRRRWRRRPAEVPGAVPDVTGGSTEDEAVDRLLHHETIAVLDVLTPEQRDVVLLRVFADLSLGEVSAVVGRPVSAVKALQRRGYARLRKALAEKNLTEPVSQDDSRTVTET